jgi:hypothetical protein
VVLQEVDMNYDFMRSGGAIATCVGWNGIIAE